MTSPVKTEMDRLIRRLRDAAHDLEGAAERAHDAVNEAAHDGTADSDAANRFPASTRPQSDDTEGEGTSTH